MAAALRAELAQIEPVVIVWIGYSGGGALARLLAPRFDETVALITIAANLDLPAWRSAHGLPPLAESLNPRDAPKLPPSTYQRHYVGGRDKVVPLSATANAVSDLDQLEIFQDFDHSCCWLGIWPEVLADLEFLSPK
jgi:pimeloyl-ACP methyl ester carboxylesterase